MWWLIEPFQNCATTICLSIVWYFCNMIWNGYLYYDIYLGRPQQLLLMCAVCLCTSVHIALCTLSRRYYSCVCYIPGVLGTESPRFECPPACTFSISIIGTTIEAYCVNVMTNVTWGGGGGQHGQGAMLPTTPVTGCISKSGSTGARRFVFTLVVASEGISLRDEIRNLENIDIILVYCFRRSFRRV